jgi:hypothetical protein
MSLDGSGHLRWPVSRTRTRCALTIRSTTSHRHRMAYSWSAMRMTVDKSGSAATRSLIEVPFEDSRSRSHSRPNFTDVCSESRATFERGWVRSSRRYELCRQCRDGARRGRWSVPIGVPTRGQRADPDTSGIPQTARAGRRRERWPPRHLARPHSPVQSLWWP